MAFQFIKTGHVLIKNTLQQRAGETETVKGYSVDVRIERSGPGDVESLFKKKKDRLNEI